MRFNYLFIFPPCYVALCASKARHRLSSESVPWCLETSLFLRLPFQDGALALPLLSLSLFFLSFMFFPPCYVALCASKACHRLGSESVSWCLETSLFLRLPFSGWTSVSTSFVSLFVFYIFPYLLLKTMGCFSGCLMSSASIQTLFCGIY